MPVSRIVVGTDFSKQSRTAVEHATAIANHLSAELVLLHADSEEEDQKDVPDVPEAVEQLARVSGTHSRASVEMLAEEADRMRDRGARISHRNVSDAPAKALCAVAEETDNSLVVTGTHGRTGFARLLLGSVAERVVHSCHRPTMVVRDRGGVPTGGYKSILVPTDFSPLANAARDLALELAADDAKIEMLHCWRLPPGAAAGPKSVLAPIIERINNDLERRLAAEIEQLDAGGRTITRNVIMVPPAKGIQGRLEAEEFDLVVMGSHGRTGLSKFFVGSVAQATLRHAPCSVAVVQST